MAGEIADVPRRRRADPGQDGADVDEDADVEIGAADPRRLHDPEQAGLVQVALGVVRQPAQPLAGLGAFGQARQQTPRPLEHLLVADARERGRSLRQCRRGAPLVARAGQFLHASTMRSATGAVKPLG
jgi:hypothetical protein